MKQIPIRLIFALFIGILAADAFTQTDTSRMFIFGHSLIDHRPPAIPTPSDETTVSHWIYLLGKESNKLFQWVDNTGFFLNMQTFLQFPNGDTTLYQESGSRTRNLLQMLIYQRFSLQRAISFSGNHQILINRLTPGSHPFRHATNH